MECSKVEEEKDIDDDTDEASVLSNIYCGGRKESLIGVDIDFVNNIHYNLGGGGCLRTISIFGMAGIGKTALAINLFEDPQVVSYFKVLMFVIVGQKYQLKGILLAILSQIGYRFDQINVEDVEELGSRLYRDLFKKRYLIVLDDVWDTRVLQELCRILPENNIGSRVLFTTRRHEVAKFNAKPHHAHKMALLDPKECWDLFCSKVFREDESYSSELLEVGKKIVDYCDGLPLAIITVANLLAEEEKTVEYWLKVANEETSTFADASEKMSPVLRPSYFYLPTYLKLCLLFEKKVGSESTWLNHVSIYYLC